MILRTLIVAAGLALALLPASAQEVERDEAALTPGRPIAAPEADRILLNGLGALTPDRLSNFRDRPLFAPNRRRPEPPAAYEPEPEPTPEPEPVAVEVSPPNVRLSGVLDAGKGAVALIQDLDANETTRIRVGDQIGEWTVVAIETSSVRLTLDDRTHDLKLFQPGAAPPPAAASADPEGIWNPTGTHAASDGKRPATGFRPHPPRQAMSHADAPLPEGDDPAAPEGDVPAATEGMPEGADMTGNQGTPEGEFDPSADFAQ